jgi:hypothetical protein
VIACSDGVSPSPQTVNNIVLRAGLRCCLSSEQPVHRMFNHNIPKEKPELPLQPVIYTTRALHGKCFKQSITATRCPARPVLLFRSGGVRLRLSIHNHQRYHIFEIGGGLGSQQCLAICNVLVATTCHEQYSMSAGSHLRATTAYICSDSVGSPHGREQSTAAQQVSARTVRRHSSPVHGSRV